VLAPDECPEPAVTRRVKPAFRLALGVDPPNSYRRSKSFQASLAKVAEGKLPAKQSESPPGRRAGQLG
jgi:hypothetical protein